jgi:hypothetical protein
LSHQIDSGFLNQIDDQSTVKVLKLAPILMTTPLLEAILRELRFPTGKALVTPTSELICLLSLSISLTVD